MDILVAAATGLKFVSSFSQYKWKSAYSNYEAKVLDENARLVAAQTAEEENRFRKGFARFEGSFRVAQAKSGVDAGGSFAWIQDSNTQAAELDALTIRYKGLIKQMGLQQAASIKKAEATMYRRQALFNSATDALGVGALTSLLTSGGAGRSGGMSPASYSSPQPGAWNFTI